MSREPQTVEKKTTVAWMVAHTKAQEGRRYKTDAENKDTDTDSSHADIHTQIQSQALWMYRRFLPTPTPVASTAAFSRS